MKIKSWSIKTWDKAVYINTLPVYFSQTHNFKHVSLYFMSSMPTCLTYLIPSLWTKRSRSWGWWSQSGPPGPARSPGLWPHTPEGTPARGPPASQTPSAGWAEGSQSAATGGKSEQRGWWIVRCVSNSYKGNLWRNNNIWEERKKIANWPW